MFYFSAGGEINANEGCFWRYNEWQMLQTISTLNVSFDGSGNSVHASVDSPISVESFKIVNEFINRIPIVPL